MEVPLDSANLSNADLDMVFLGKTGVVVKAGAFDERRAHRIEWWREIFGTHLMEHAQNGAIEPST